MTEQEIFEKLKEVFDYQYMYDSLECGNERKELDNLEGFKDVELKRLNTYKEFIHYLHDKAIIGNIDRELLSALKAIVLILSLDTSPSQKC